MYYSNSLYVWVIKLIICFNSVKFVHFYYSRFSGNNSSEVSLLNWANYTFHIYHFWLHIYYLNGDAFSLWHVQAASAIHIPSQAKSVRLAYTTNESVVHIHIYYLMVIVWSLWHSASDLLYNCYTQLLYTTIFRSILGAEKSVT